MRIALRHENADKPCEILMTLATDEIIRNVNRTHRGINQVTDVLSFPLTKQTPRRRLVASEPGDINPRTGRLALGDIVLCVPQAFRQSREYGHSLERELSYLTVHSMLHLLGYDHREDEDKKKMRKREDEIMEILEIHR
jgi:probable rRNA maturation factor